MFVSNVLGFIHKYTGRIYENSLILRNIDNFVLGFILLTFIFSTFANSDIIGYFGIITGILTVIRILFTPRDGLKCEKFELFLLAYFMIAVISTAGASHFGLSFKGLLKTFIYLWFYLSVVHHFKYNKKSILPVLVTIACCAGVQGIIGIVQSCGHVAEISGWQDVSNLNPEQVISRVYGTLLPYNPNLLGGYFVLTIPSAAGLFGYYAYEKKYPNACFFGILTFVCVISLFMTGCRGAYVALFGMIIGLFLLSFKFFCRQYEKLYLLCVTLFAGAGAAVLSICPPVRVRIFSIFAMRADSSNSFRFNVYEACVNMFKDNWLLGIGQGNLNFREVYGLYMKTGFDALSSYNIYLETAVEGGIFMLATFLGVLFSILGEAFGYIKNTDNLKNVIFISIPLFAVVGAMFHGLVDTVFFRPQNQIIFWTMIAVLSNKLYCSEYHQDG